tara:strand:- start:175 stop:435 length:261 start_codon:yes stop_codon:yes gene_type:complete
MSSSKITIGPFAETRQAMDDFCQNLYLTYAMNECAMQLNKIQEEYNEALLCDDEVLAEQKRLQLQAYQSSLTLTAYMFDEVDEIST